MLIGELDGCPKKLNISYAYLGNLAANAPNNKNN